MKICFPIVKNEGLKSQINGHFGSTRDFLIFDTDNASFEVKSNNDADHRHGMCQPLKALAGVKVDAVIVGGLGTGALLKLNALGTKVFRAMPGSVEHNLGCYQNGLLSEMNPSEACLGHDGCSHN